MKPFKNSALLFMWHYVKKNKLIFAIIVACSFASIVLGKLTPYYFSRLVGLFGNDTDFADIKNKVWLFLGLVIGLQILSSICSLIHNWLMEVKFRPTTYKQMQLDLFKYLNGHSVAFFADNMAGALATKANELAMGGATLFVGLVFYANGWLSLIVVLTMLGLASIKFMIVFFIMMIISCAVLYRLGKISVGLRAKMTEAQSEASGQMIDTWQNAFFVRIFNGFAYENKRVENVLKTEARATNKSVNVEMMQTEGEKLYFQLVYLLFLFYGFYLWKNSELSAADLVLIVLLLKDVSSTVSFLLHRGIIYNGILAEMRTNLQPFTVAHEIVDAPNAKKLKIKKGEIEFKNISFAYKGNKTLFNKLNLTIPAGQKVGIVGKSGGGKSTLINLVQRFYEVADGQILLDGQDIKTVTQESLHQAIGYIPQTTNLLERSIADNIAYGRPNATEKQIKQAAKDAYADEFIESLPKQYKTVLNAENQLSGGQMQRISIARALLKNAPILILDEATSALDSESEFYIQKAIEKMIQDKTVLVIAHRLSTLKNMDRIVVLEKGKIVEDGTLSELMQKRGRFYEYWQMQRLQGDADE